MFHNKKTQNLSCLRLPSAQQFTIQDSSLLQAGQKLHILYQLLHQFLLCFQISTCIMVVGLRIMYMLDHLASLHPNYIPISELFFNVCGCHGKVMCVMNKSSDVGQLNGNSFWVLNSSIFHLQFTYNTIIFLDLFSSSATLLGYLLLIFPAILSLEIKFSRSKLFGVNLSSNIHSNVVSSLVCFDKDNLVRDQKTLVDNFFSHLASQKAHILSLICIKFVFLILPIYSSQLIFSSLPLIPLLEKKQQQNCFVRSACKNKHI